MFWLLLSSIEDEEVEYWTAQIAHFRKLLDMHSLSFDTTHLAAIRGFFLMSKEVRISRLIATWHQKRPPRLTLLDFGAIEEASIEPSSVQLAGYGKEFFLNVLYDTMDP